jgi:hypothetical protein
MLFTVEMRRKRGRWGDISCLCSRTVHVLLRQGEGQKGRKRLGQQPSHVTSGSARYIKKGEGERGNAKQFFTTIAVDLIAHELGMLPVIQEALDKDSKIADKSLKDQFEKLILQPLLRIKQA